MLRIFVYDNAGRRVVEMSGLSILVIEANDDITQGYSLRTHKHLERWTS